MRTKIAVVLGGSISFFSKLIKYGGGTAAPGLYALKVDPNLVSKLASKIPKNIVITGTNGKTTTSRMIAHFAKASGLKVIRNHTGSNLERGIASTLISNFRHLKKADLGIWELDEAAFNSVVPKLNPNIVVFLNVSRDQLDRYGEVDKVVNNWCETLKSLPQKTTILLNKDDKSLNKLEKCFKGKTIKFHKPKEIKTKGLEGTEFEIYSKTAFLPIPGIYNVYDTVAALAIAEELKIPLSTCIQSLKTYKPAFGRVEKFPWGYIFLIKNPAGATQVFQTISPELKEKDTLFLALNDDLADGTDVSWIWDASFENLVIKNLKFKIICSGTRAYDLATRLKYAGFNSNQIILELDLQKAFREARTGLKGRLFILPTYTAMLSLQKLLTNLGIKGHYWEES